MASMASSSLSAAVGSYTGVTTADTKACTSGRSAGMTDQSDVTVGQQVEVTFRGSPPFNISRSVGHGGLYYCDTPIEGNVTSNHWQWTVEPFFWPADKGGPNATVLNPGDTVMFAVTELAEGLVNHYYTSANFTIVSHTTNRGSRAQMTQIEERLDDFHGYDYASPFTDMRAWGRPTDTGERHWMNYSCDNGIYQRRPLPWYNEGQKYAGPYWARSSERKGSSQA